MLTSLILTALRGAIVFALVLAAMPLLRRASAATRRTLLVFAFAAVVVLPLATAVLPSLHVGPETATIATTIDRDALAAASSPDSIARARIAIDETTPRSTPGAKPSIVAEKPLPSPLEIVLVIWALGAAIVLARFGLGLWRARELARGARSIGVEHGCEIRESAAIETPAVVGVFAPIVLLPREAREWTAERRRVVLQHELAHVDRCDGLANALAQIACALHWFDPLAWIAARRLRFERELAADDRVLDEGTCASTYAEHLLALATAHDDVPAGVLAIADRSHVATRIGALLEAKRSRASLSPARATIAGACAAIVVSAIACTTPEPEPAAPPVKAESAPPVTKATISTPTKSTIVRRGGASLDAIADLTIDPALQAIAEEETDRLVADWKPTSAFVIVIDPRTGRVQAMTSRGTDAAIEVAAQRAFVPGSTMKPLVMAAALEENAITATQKFDGNSGRRAYGDREIRDPKSRGAMDVSTILAVSSNVGMTHVSEALGGEKLASWTRRFHLDGTAPLQLPNVAPGTVPSKIADDFEGAEVAIGARTSHPPIQIAAAFATLANGGIYHAPTLTKSSAITDERIVREDTARTVMSLLEGVVTSENGTGKAARVEGVRVAGKTGTADLTPDDTSSPGPYYASFVGAAPLEAPRYVILVGAESPRDHGSGGQVAAPTFGRIMTRLLAR